MARRPKSQKYLNDKREQMSKDPNVKKIQMKRRLKWQEHQWQEDPSDKKTQMIKRPKWQDDWKGKNSQITGRHKWQEDTYDTEWVAKRLTDIMLTNRMLTDEHPPIC